MLVFLLTCDLCGGMQSWVQGSVGEGRGREGKGGEGAAGGGGGGQHQTVCQ